jgi:predicted  nucleic acid-binding Zn-ribbon protein
MTQNMTCPKCGHQHIANDESGAQIPQCPACGIYYFKYYNQQRNQKPRKRPTSTATNQSKTSPSPISRMAARQQSVFHANFMTAGCNHENREAFINHHVRADDPAVLLRDPHNPHSQYAVKILTKSGHHIGFVPETDARYIAQALDAGNIYRAVFTKIIGQNYPIPVVDVHFFNQSENRDADHKPKKNTSLSAYFGVGLFAFFVFTVAKKKIEAHDYVITHANEIAAREEACKTDLKCAGDKYDSLILSPCSRLIEQHAKYQYRWDGIRFGRYDWANTEKTKLIYFGDAVQFQNGFSAWQNMIYSCTYDIATNKITDVAVAPGQIPK